MEQASAFSHPGYYYKENEDCFLLFSREENYLLAVADGLGGHSQGKLASHKAIENLEKHFSLGSDLGKEQIYWLLESANQAVYSLEGEGGKKPATTLSLVWLRGRKFFIGHVGDSRVYYWRAGKLSLLTQDHSLLAELARPGQWIPKRYYQKFGHIVARSLGISKEFNNKFMEDDLFTYVLGPFSLEEGDILLLTTDGLNRHLTEAEIQSLVSENFKQKAGKIAQILVEEALARGGEDNITVLIRKDGKGEENG